MRHYPIMTALVLGNCPQHVQMLAVFGKQAGVETALDKIREVYNK